MNPNPLCQGGGGGRGIYHCTTAVTWAVITKFRIIVQNISNIKRSTRKAKKIDYSPETKDVYHELNHLVMASSQHLVHVQNFFLGGWQAVSLGGGVTVMEKQEILAGWVTKVCLKCTEKLG